MKIMNDILLTDLILEVHNLEKINKKEIRETAKGRIEVHVLST